MQLTTTTVRPTGAVVVGKNVDSNLSKLVMAYLINHRNNLSTCAGNSLCWFFFSAQLLHLVCRPIRFLHTFNQSLESERHQTAHSHRVSQVNWTLSSPAWICDRWASDRRKGAEKKNIFICVSIAVVDYSGNQPSRSLLHVIMTIVTAMRWWLIFVQLRVLRCRPPSFIILERLLAGNWTGWHSQNQMTRRS